MNKLHSAISVLLVSLSFSFSCAAHQFSTSYLTLDAADQSALSMSGSWQVEISDLEQQIAFDLNQDGEISWQEITAKKTAIYQFLQFAIGVNQAGQACSLNNRGQLKLDSHFNQPYVDIPVVINCPASSAIDISYRAFFANDANHKAIVAINYSSAKASYSASRVFSQAKQLQHFDFNQSSYYQTFVEYVYQGVIHIWLGLDHILFLIALLLTCVLVRKEKKWQGMSSKLHIFKNTAWIVTAFTLAHSITLTATAMELISPNSRWVELGIAISVLFAALNNIWPLIIRLGWVTFAFGLLHGMGFASVLGELGLSSRHQLLSVLAFNIGVEIGQLAILAIALPVLIAIRKFNWYQQWLMPAGSLTIALIAVQWSVERI
ncbi:HupE/UreJ family protein [Alteromonadaceae bacterium BrNp21-10]|nr:HupE/UreJ family protein [Alteromonadaceae bacterium BrNp21-10]